MIFIKNQAEVEVIAQGGKILGSILKKLLSLVKPGVSTVELEKVAEEMIIEAGGRPAFKNYPLPGGLFFPSTLCVSINEEVVHGASLPNRLIHSGDIVDLDIGMEWPVDLSLRRKLKLATNPHSPAGGFYTDTCATVPVGKVSKSALKLIKTSRQCLESAIEIIKPGVSLHEIGSLIESIARQAGFSSVKDFVGHGLGYFAHEDPDIYHYAIDPKSANNIKLKAGMILAIEPMINAGQEKVKIGSNGYTALTADGSLSAHFEHTVAVTADGYRILTLR